LDCVNIQICERQTCRAFPLKFISINRGFGVLGFWGFGVDRHCQLEFGTYVQVHESHDNSMLPQTSGALALWPSGNAQGGYYFFSLSTGQVIH